MTPVVGSRVPAVCDQSLDMLLVKFTEGSFSFFGGAVVGRERKSKIGEMKMLGLAIEGY
jgi:hypothetical protein